LTKKPSGLRLAGYDSKKRSKTQRSKDKNLGEIGHFQTTKTKKMSKKNEAKKNHTKPQTYPPDKKKKARHEVTSLKRKGSQNGCAENKKVIRTEIKVRAKNQKDSTGKEKK